MTNALQVDWVEQTVALETDRSGQHGLGYAITFSPHGLIYYTGLI